MESLISKAVTIMDGSDDVDTKLSGCRRHVQEVVSCTRYSAPQSKHVPLQRNFNQTPRCPMYIFGLTIAVNGVSEVIGAAGVASESPQGSGNWSERDCGSPCVRKREAVRCQLDLLARATRNQRGDHNLPATCYPEGGCEGRRAHTLLACFATIRPTWASSK